MSAQLDFAFQDGGEQSKLELAFWEFHKSHPEVYRRLVKLARDWFKRGRGRIGIATVFETARYTLAMETDSDGLKLNNNHRAFYARLIMEREPDLDGMFGLRKQKIQATIGPDNDDLPPSDHIS